MVQKEQKEQKDKNKRKTEKTERPASLKKRVLKLETTLAAFQKTVTDQLLQLADRQAALLRKTAG